MISKTESGRVSKEIPGSGSGSGTRWALLVGLSADYFHYMADFFLLGGYLSPPPDLKLFVFESQMRMIFTNSGSDYDRSTRRLRISTFRFPLHFVAVSK